MAVLVGVLIGLWLIALWLSWFLVCYGATSVVLVLREFRGE